MRTKREINLIYKHTHRDFKSNSNGVKKVMFLSERGWTTLGPIESLPEKIFKDKLEYAYKKECKAVALKTFSKKYGRIVGDDYVKDGQCEITVLNEKEFVFRRPQKEYTIQFRGGKITNVVCY